MKIKLFQKLDENTFRFSPSLEFIDLSYNNLNIVKTSFLAQNQRLLEINLSHNHIARFEHNSFLPLSQLRVLNLSFNKIMDINGGDFQQLTGLYRIDLSGNPILIIQPNNFVLPSVEELLLSGCQNLRVIDSNAFAQMPRLQLLNLNNSTSLQYLSATALSADKTIDRLFLKDSALEILSEKILQNVKHISLENSQLKCGCIKLSQNQTFTSRENSDNFTCLNSNGNRQRISEVTIANDTCDLQPILPFGALVNVTVGGTISMYCVPKLQDDEILWTLPNQLQKLQNLTQSLRPQESHHFGISAYYAIQSPYYNALYRPRFAVEHEKIRFDVVTVEDSGTYKCTVQRQQNAVERTIVLNVLKPNIQLRVVEAGPYYITVAWNASLNIKAKERVAYFLSAQSKTGSSNRVIQLSLYNPWHNYNVVRLKPDTNYTICLSYTLRNNAQETPLYKTCTNTSTLKNPAVFGSVGIIFLTLLSTSSLIFCFITCLNFIHFRVDISQHEKHRSRMNQSTSGQSILPRSNHERDVTMSFENFCQTKQFQNSRSMAENEFHLAIIDSSQPAVSRNTESLTTEELNL
uniref:Ig-like domain-containing protein n=1 Tax=Syphacia muris TaxID=451379 RepID=A0A0N5APL5_9BILA